MIRCAAKTVNRRRQSYASILTQIGHSVNGCALERERPTLTTGAKYGILIKNEQLMMGFYLLSREDVAWRATQR